MSGLVHGARRDAKQAWLFGRGLRRFLHDPLDSRQALATVEQEMESRDARFLGMVDRMVWPVPTSPYRALLRHAGVDRAGLRDLVVHEGLDAGLTALLDAGVYLSYEEAQGTEPVRRGSLSLSIRPTDLSNPLLRADFVAGTSGTRSGGTAVPTSFRSLRRMARSLLLTDHLWEVHGAPHALWRPALPASGGLIAALAGAVSGAPPVAWFSPTDPDDPAMMLRKRVANRLLPLVARSAGQRIPTPRHVPSHEPERVLEWCRQTLGASGSAALNAYPSAAVALAGAASTSGHDLEGLVIRMVGEPTTAARMAAVRASGATPVDAYAFAQLGVAATACPQCEDEELHVFDHEAAVVPRRRHRPDGVVVDALAWTTLAFDARMVMINTENDDYADVSTRGCTCLLGRMGMRTRVRHVRGLTKSVAAGVTVPGDLLQRLVDIVLPGAAGGRPGQWQLVEAQEGGATVVRVRADPDLGALDDERIRTLVLDELRRTDVGSLAAGMWSAPTMLQLERERPARTAAGKVLAYHVQG